MIQVTLLSSEDTETLGARLASQLPEGCTVYLEGDLGAGKTTLVRGFLRALGYSGTVKSPTYTLLEPYTVAGRQVIHLDLYRLADPDELAFIGLRDMLDEPTVVLIEWPQQGQGMLPMADLVITLDYDEQGRLGEIRAVSVVGEAVLTALETET